MSVIIKGMELPEKCENCPCYDYIDCVCRADDCFAPFDVENPEERSEHCPLVEIPTPHGRLIDENELLRHKYGFSQTARTIIKNTNAVIEAEVSE